MDEIIGSKKDLENLDDKEQNIDNSPHVEEQDRDNELDYESGKQIDNTTSLKYEKGRPRLQRGTPIDAFKDLFSSDIWAALKRFGGSPAPLSLIGTFLNYAGNHVLNYIHEKYK